MRDDAIDAMRYAVALRQEKIIPRFLTGGRITAPCFFDTVGENENISCFAVEPKHITRKRFIKLLMARGMQRNQANKLAKEIHKEKGFYTELDLFGFYIKSFDPKARLVKIPKLEIEEIKGYKTKIEGKR